MGKTIYNRSKGYRYGKYIVWSIIAICLFACKTPKKEGIRLLFTGDILLSRNVAKEIEYVNVSPWSHIGSIFDSADFVMGNLEGAVIADSNSLKGGNLYFDIEPEFLDYIYHAGIDAVSIENNHSCDFGELSKLQTTKTLHDKQIVPVSFDSSPFIFKMKSKALSLISLNAIRDKCGNIDKIPSVALLQKLRLSRKYADYVIVFIHWGTELLEWPNSQQRSIADWLTKNGADIIIGSHPHVIQNVEIINGKPVYFSLGNHLFDQKYLPTHNGLIADIRLSESEIACNGIITYCTDRSFYPQYTRDTSFFTVPYFKSISEKLYQDRNIDIESVISEEFAGISITKSENDVTKWTTPPMSIIDISEFTTQKDSQFVFMLKKHYSSLDKSVELRPYVYSIDKYGLNAKWRGSALAWPLLDAQIHPHQKGVICALHRGDSYIVPDPTTPKRRIMAYLWNGFGFEATTDSSICNECIEMYNEVKDY